jgi:hypothetical protein
MTSSVMSSSLKTFRITTILNVRALFLTAPIIMTLHNDTHHNDTQTNDTQRSENLHNDTQHEDMQNKDTLHSNT